MSQQETNNWRYLIHQYLTNKISREEFEYLLKHIEDQNGLVTLMPVFQDIWDETIDVSSEERKEWDAKFDIMMQKLKPGESPVIKPSKGRLRKMYRLAAASILLFMFGAGGYYLFSRIEKSETNSKYQIAATSPADVQPGSNGAILTLSDGRQIILDSTGNGTLATESTTHIVKKGGQVIYHASGSGADVNVNTPVTYNTMSTPMGKEYQLVLPDGSKVWLNAASSITFPTSFTGKERRVAITGEAYFEVMPLNIKNGKGTVPFIVSINPASHENTDIEVLGTHFNVNAYPDEDVIKTTLVEGAVRVRKGLESSVITPGQQAQMISNGGIKLIKNADVEEATAWKNGRFDFDNTKIEMIMRQVARWYNVEVIYKAKIDEHYTVNILRNIPVSNLLKYLEMSGGVRFEIDENKIIVTQ